jgi:malate dehydrogenase (oxaloacetate-decarboxylating)(NADP+)
VFNGAGAAGIATARFFERLGVRHENILMCDSRGVIFEGGKEGMSGHKSEFARSTDKRTLAEALVGADCFVGVSVADVVTKEMVQSMADKPIIFALANPNPEIRYEDAIAARPDAIVATGRSDYPNQVNNVLGFPFIFRGALDVRARGISEGMKVAAAHALASLAREPVPESVLKAYSIDHLAFGAEYLIPKPFDPRVLWHVAPAVAQAAVYEGIARTPYADIEMYREELRSRFQPAYGLTHSVATKAQEHPMRVVYPHGTDIRIVRAARRVVDERIAAPVILGNVEEIHAIAEEKQVALDGIDIFNPYNEPETQARYAAELYRLRGRKGIAPEDAHRAILEPNLYAAMMLHEGDADAVLGGLTSSYPDTVRPALQVLPLDEGRSIVSAIYAVILKDQTYFLADCAVNILPTSEQLAEIAISTADYVQHTFDVEPRVALLSYSNFGSASGEEPERVRKAVTLCWDRRPDLQVDGEMHARTAVDAPLLARQHAFNKLGGRANVLVFPNLAAGNAAYQLLSKLGGAQVIGPILTGVSQSVHVLQRDAEVGDIVNLTAIAVLDAQNKV